MKKKLIIAAPFVALLLWGATSGNLEWTQLRSDNRHGTNAKGQSSDGTGTSGNFAKYNSSGGLTDGAVPPATKSAVSHFFITAYDAVTGLFSTAQPTDSDLSTSDITTNNVSTSKHGFAPKLPNDATKYLDGTGAYSVPAGGGGGFYTVDPAGVSGIYGLYYADQGCYKDAGVTLCSAGDTIQQWNDQSGLGHNLSQATSGKRPTYQTAGGPLGLTNRTVWAGGQCLTLASAAISTFTIFVLMRGTGTAGIIYEQGPNINTNDGFVIYGNITNSYAVRKSGIVSGRDNNSGWGTQGNWLAFAHRYAGTHGTHDLSANTWVDIGSLTGSASSDPGTSTITDTLNIGARNNAASLGFTGDIACIAIFTPYISRQNVIGIMNFLVNKYNY